VTVIVLRSLMKNIHARGLITTGVVCGSVPLNGLPLRQASQTNLKWCSISGTKPCALLTRLHYLPQGGTRELRYVTIVTKHATTHRPTMTLVKEGADSRRRRAVGHPTPPKPTYSSTQWAHTADQRGRENFDLSATQFTLHMSGITKAVHPSTIRTSDAPNG